MRCQCGGWIQSLGNGGFGAGNPVLVGGFRSSGVGLPGGDLCGCCVGDGLAGKIIRGDQ